MSENLQKLVGVVVMAVLVVVGVVVSSGDDTDFTRNTAFTKGGVVAKDAGAEKGGDCCDETLYRLGQIEDRLSRIELALEGNPPVANESAEHAQDLDDHLMVESLRMQRRENWRDLYASYVGYLVGASGLLIGVEVEVARAAVRQIGLGFEHVRADGEPTGEIERRGTWRDDRNSALLVGVSTLNGIVETVQGRHTPGTR